MPTLVSARSHYRQSALIARRAVREARKARKAGVVSVASVVAAHQIAQAQASQAAVAQMLTEQDIASAAEALLNLPAFTTSVESFAAMAEAAAVRIDELQASEARPTALDASFDRLVESIVQDAGRAAESVATAVRPDIYHVRYVSPPCCARCAVLAGRVYRYSEGFLRHPNCDCSMIPTTVASPFAQSPDSLFESGQIRGLSKADAKAVADGADLGKVINVRLRKAGLRESGRVLARRGRLTPEAIYRATSSRTEAVELLAANGYLT